MRHRPSTMDRPASDGLPPSPEVLFHEARQRRRRRRRQAIAAVLALAAIGAAVGYGATVGGGGPATSTTTPAASTPALSTTWRGAGSVLWPFTPPGNFPASPTSSITCAGTAATSCYAVVQDSAAKSGGPSFVFRSTDRGDTWSAVTLPMHASLTTSMSCWAPASCAVGAVTGGIPGYTSKRAIVLLTTDDGRRWTEHLLPKTVGLLEALSCNSSTHCTALAWNRDPATIGGLQSHSGATDFLPTRIFVSDNGARSWSTTRLPKPPEGDRYSLSSMTCPSAARCIFAGTEAHITNVHIDGRTAGYVPTDRRTLVFTSDNGGVSAKVIFHRAGPVACSSASHCLMVTTTPGSAAKRATVAVFRSTDGGSAWVPVHQAGITAAPTSALECTSEHSCVAVTDLSVATTNDGGRRWVVDTSLPPASSGFRAEGIDAVSCSTSGTCLALQTLLPTPINTTRWYLRVLTTGR